MSDDNISGEDRMMGRYVVRLRHDSGTVRLVIYAESGADAIERVCRIEGAPHRAVLSVRRLVP